MLLASLFVDVAKMGQAEAPVADALQLINRGVERIPVPERRHEPCDEQIVPKLVAQRVPDKEIAQTFIQNRNVARQCRGRRR